MELAVDAFRKDLNTKSIFSGNMKMGMGFGLQRVEKAE